MKRISLLTLVLMLAIALTCCAPKPVQQGMATADGLTFLASTVTDERTGTVAVTVTMTNGTGGALYLAAPELATADGTTAVYLDLTIPAASNELSGLTPTGLTRWLHLDPRESYQETRTFVTSLPAELTVTVRSAASYSDEFSETRVTMALK